MTSNPDQARTKNYLTETLEYIKKTTRSVDSNKKDKTWNYAIVSLFNVTLRVLHSKVALLNEADIISTSKFQKILTALKGSLLVHMQPAIKKLGKKLSKNEESMDLSLTLLSIIEALPVLGVTASELASIRSDTAATKVTQNISTADRLEVGERLKLFFISNSDPADSGSLHLVHTGDVSTSFGRQSIIKTAQLLVDGKDQKERFDVLASLVGQDNDGLMEAESLLAIRHVIAACEGIMSSAFIYSETMLTIYRYTDATQ